MTLKEIEIKSQFENKIKKSSVLYGWNCLFSRIYHKEDILKGTDRYLIRLFELNKVLPQIKLTYFMHLILH